MSQTLLERLLKRVHCYDAIGELEAMTIYAPDEAVRISEEYLRRSDPWSSDPGVDGSVVSCFLQAGGERSRNWLIDQWPTLNDKQRTVIASGAWFSDGMSETLALELFHHPTSTVSDRHQIAAGLAVTAKERNLNDRIVELVDQIGTYPPELAHRQKNLDRFVEDVHRTFGGTPTSRTVSEVA